MLVTEEGKPLEAPDGNKFVGGEGGVGPSWTWGADVAAAGGVGEQLTSWPTLLGKPSKEVVAQIKKDRPDLKVTEVPADAMVTMDFDESRVRVFVGDGSIVAKVPRTG